MCAGAGHLGARLPRRRAPCSPALQPRPAAPHRPGSRHGPKNSASKPTCADSRPACAGQGRAAGRLCMGMALRHAARPLPCSSAGSAHAAPAPACAPTCVEEWPNGSICQPTRGTAPNVCFRKLRAGGRAGGRAEGDARPAAMHRRRHGHVPAPAVHGLPMPSARASPHTVHPSVPPSRSRTRGRGWSGPPLQHSAPPPRRAAHIRHSQTPAAL